MVMTYAIKTLICSFFHIDDVIVATNTTNVPLGFQHVKMRQESNSAAARTLSVDYLDLVQTRS